MLETSESPSTFATPLSTPMTNVQIGLVSAILTASVITIIINPLTLLALFKQKMITKSSINLFIASLCCSDFLFGFAICIFQLQKLQQLTSASENLITFLSCTGGMLGCAGFFVSSTNLLLVSVDRAYAILAPFKYKTHMSVKRASIILAVAWTSATLQAIVPAFIKIAREGAVIVDNAYEMHPYSFRLYWAMPLLYIGTAANVVLYFIIVISFFKSRKKVQPSSDVRSRRMTRTVTMVIGTILIGNVPVVTMAAISDNPEAPYLWSYAMFNDIAFVCALIPTFFNNFLYVWQLPDFNRAVKLVRKVINVLVNVERSHMSAYGSRNMPPYKNIWASIPEQKTTPGTPPMPYCKHTSRNMFSSMVISK
ncbi:hypothetical protein CAPTEDRAFT_189229 [Capitella teleta]|uniref:G-protein coupled receptors family 1 profile domain-containing protein n=1 Tax=Capitella teleta TaxID=283909 RepID=R7TB06_CAPTE|nr:hypothetical protein CAPTEDRAFT_189229 [Capitella teleta]|eukprot:ELT90879.1 hypothetical protein CAPTEDRAFT_189229 [Capitella teleta]